MKTVMMDHVMDTQFELQYKVQYKAFTEFESSFLFLFTGNFDCVNCVMAAEFTSP